MAMRKPYYLRFIEADDADKDKGGGGGGSEKGNENGFPRDTPLVEMTTEQQLAYWKFHARQHEGVAKSRADYDQQKADAEKWRQAQKDALTPDQKAIDDAVTKAREETRKDELKKLAPRLVKAEFKALAGKDVPAELLNGFLEDVDFTTYLNDDGEVNTEKVQKRVTALTPKGTQQRLPNHQGYRKNDGATSVSAGRSLYADRNKNKKG